MGYDGVINQLIARGAPHFFVLYAGLSAEKQRSGESGGERGKKRHHIFFCLYNSKSCR